MHPLCASPWSCRSRPGSSCLGRSAGFSRIDRDTLPDDLPAIADALRHHAARGAALILTTGGTIDKVYFDARSTYEVGPPNIEIVLGELDLAIDYSVRSLLKKDSLEITDEDRALLTRVLGNYIEE